MVNALTLQFTLEGDYSNSIWQVSSDGNGGFNIVDPPATAGVLEASNGGTLQVQDAVTGGNAVIAGGIMQFDAATSSTVTFDNGAAGTSYGLLILIDPSRMPGMNCCFCAAVPKSDALTPRPSRAA